MGERDGRREPRFGLDPIEITRAAATKPYGIHDLLAGRRRRRALHPVRPALPAARACASGAPTRRSRERAMKAIESRPHVVAERVVELLEDAGVEPAEGRVLVVGASYKPGVRDMRESPAVRIMRSCRSEGVAVAYHDPLVRSLEAGDGLACSRCRTRGPATTTSPAGDAARRLRLRLAGRVRARARLHVPHAARRAEVTDLVAAHGEHGAASHARADPVVQSSPCALVCALYLALIVTAVIAYKTVFIEIVVADPWFGVYSVVVCVFILSRFLFSLFYHPAPDAGAAAGADDRGRDAGLQRGGRGRRLDPLAADRRLSPREARDRGRRTTAPPTARCARSSRWRTGNRVGARDRLPGEPRQAGRDGGRHPRHSAAVVAFVDSDSSLERDALRKIVRGFADPQVGAIAGHAEVENARES